MNEYDNNFNIFHGAMVAFALWIALGMLGFDLWSDWLYPMWLSLCGAVSALGIALYNFLEWLLMKLLILGAIGVACYSAFLVLKFIYDVTWRRIAIHDDLFLNLQSRIIQLDGYIQALEHKVARIERKDLSAIKGLAKAVLELEAYTGLTAQKEADKLAAAFEKQQKELQASEERGV
ncbi:MAG: hypothetical protein ACRBBP_03420 [Bdellovibrionales bacterium]